MPLPYQRRGDTDLSAAGHQDRRDHGPVLAGLITQRPLDREPKRDDQNEDHQRGNQDPDIVTCHSETSLSTGSGVPTNQRYSI